MLGPLTGWISSSRAVDHGLGAIIRYSTGSPFTRVMQQRGL
jgi:hypothetical protein